MSWMMDEVTSASELVYWLMYAGMSIADRRRRKKKNKKRERQRSKVRQKD